MMITRLTPTASAQEPRSAAIDTDGLTAAADRQDVVDISRTARALQAGQMAVSHPAALLSDEQVQVKMGLLGTFMAILFGRQESDQTSPAQEVAQAMLEKPATAEALQILRDNGWVV
ncbi:MAG: hypothetical protein H7838_04060 [Magnetococcus sp. DMHC-8]